MERKFTYGVKWYDEQLPLFSIKAHNMPEADKKAREIIAKEGYEGTFILRKLTGGKCKDWIIYYGEYKPKITEEYKTYFKYKKIKL